MVFTGSDMRKGSFDLVLPIEDPVMRLLGRRTRRIRVGFARYASRNPSHVMDSKTDQFDGRHGAELVL